MNDEFIGAAQTGDINKVKLLLTNPEVNPAAIDNRAILLASENGHTEIVRLLLSDPRVDPTAENNWAIRSASRHGHTEVVRLLLADPRVDPAANDNYVIRLASLYDRTEVVKLLLTDSRVDPAANNNLAIRWASENGHVEVVRLLLTDPRVDWRYADSNIKNELIKDQENKLKKELTTSYLSLERSSPQVRIEGKVKSQIPKEIIKQTTYAGPYEELCMKIKNSKIPPVKLVALAKILKVEYDDKIEWSKLCDRVKHAIFVSLYLHQ